MTIATLHIVKKGTLKDSEIEHLRNSHPEIEIIKESEYLKRIDQANRKATEEIIKEIGLLSFSGKLAWYSKRNSQEIVFLGNNPYFQKYWKHRVLWPMKIMRLFYRIKNGEIFKRYHHISEMKEKVKKHSI